MRRATEQGLNMGWTRYKYTTIVKPDCCNSRASFIFWYKQQLLSFFIL